MKVVCTNNRLPNDGPNVYVLTVGREYLVIGLTFREGGTWLDIQIDPGVVVSAPINFFDVVDDRASRFWRVRVPAPGEVSLRPEEFDMPFFLDDASNSLEPASSALEALIGRMQSEH